MGHKSCAVLLANRETAELLIEGSFGLGDEYVHALNTNLKQKISGDGPESRSVTAQAFRTGMPVYAPDITEDPRFAPLARGRSARGIQLHSRPPTRVFRNEVIGVLNCYDEPREYTEGQVEALIVVAEQTASAVGIARMISAQRSTIEQLNSLNEHVTAQHALLQRSEKTHETLAALLLENRSLDNITNALSDVLDAPVVLQDDGLRSLSPLPAPKHTVASRPTKVFRTWTRQAAPEASKRETKRFSSRPWTSVVTSEGTSLRRSWPELRGPSPSAR